MIREPRLILILIIIESDMRSDLYYWKRLSSEDADRYLASLDELLDKNEGIIRRRKLYGLLKFILSLYD